MANGTAALHALVEPPSAIPATPGANKRDAVSDDLGVAVASAALAVTAVLDGYVSSGSLPQVAKDATAIRVAAIATLQLDHAGSDADFIRQARTSGRCELLRKLSDAGFFQVHSQADADAITNWSLDAVFEIVAFVVEGERLYRARWAN